MTRYSGEAFHSIDASTSLYPTVGISAKEIRVRVYFASKTFKTSLEAVLQPLVIARLELGRNPLRLPTKFNPFTTRRGHLSENGLTILPTGKVFFELYALSFLKTCLPDRRKGKQR